jgi:AraC-like DNA-binding protein
VPITEYQSPVIPPGEKFAADYRAGYRQLVLRIDTETLNRSLAALLGEPAPHRAMFELSVSDNRPAAATLRRLVTFLANELDAPRSHIPDVALAELADSVVHGFVAGASRDFARAIEQKPKAVAPWQVRRAEEYIKANWNKPITNETLAEVTSCSALALIKTFRQQRGCSPRAFAKRKRLQYARWMLTTADREQTSVAEVAYECGFHDENRFAASYLRSYGELPSETQRYPGLKRWN